MFTPLLASGKGLRWKEQEEIELDDGHRATIARCSILKEGLFFDNEDSEFQLLFAHVPETIGFIPDLICHPKTSFAAGPSFGASRFQRFVWGFGGVGPEYQAVKVSHPGLRHRYRIKADADVGLNWLTQLFSPRVLDWLAEEPPPGFGFELTHGWLVAFISLEMNWIGSDFDQLTACSGVVADALRREAEEERGLEFAGRSSSSDRGEGARRERLRRFAEATKWREPPASEAAATRRFMPRAVFRPRNILAALLSSLPLGLFFLVFTFSSPQWWLAPAFAAFMTAALSYEMGKRNAQQLGLFSFVDSYARERGLRREDPRLFQARHLGLGLTAVVDEALSGVKVGERVGTLALFHGTGRDLNSRYQALIVPLGGTVDESVLEPQLGRSGQLIRDDSLLSWMPLDTGEPSVESLDAFIAQTERLYPSLLRSGS